MCGLSIAKILLAAFFLFSAFSPLGFAYGSNASLSNTAIVLSNTTVNATTSYWISFVTSGVPDGVATNVLRISLVFPASFSNLGTPAAGTLYLNGSASGITLSTLASSNTMQVFLSASTGALSDTNFTFQLNGVKNAQTLNPSGESISIQTFNSTNESGWGPNSTTVFLTPAPAFSISIYSGNTQTGTVNNTLVNALVALVTDDFGNPIAGYPVTFTALNSSGAAVGLNTTLIGVNAYATINATTNAQGQASAFAFLGTTTMNSTATQYWFNASGFNLTSATKHVVFSSTPQAGKIAHYTLVPSNATPLLDAPFTIFISSIDAFNNVNATSSWSPTMDVQSTNELRLQYSLNGGSTYSNFSGTAFSFPLTNGNASVYFKHGFLETITFAASDSNGASGTTSVTISGTRSSTPTPTPTSTPTPTPSATASATPTPTRTPTSTATPTSAPTSTAPAPTPQPSSPDYTILIIGVLSLAAIGGLVYWIATRPKQGL